MIDKNAVSLPRNVLWDDEFPCHKLLKHVAGLLKALL